MLPQSNRRFDLLVVVTSLMAIISFSSSARSDDDKPSDEKTTALLKTFVDEFVTITPGEGKFPASFRMGSTEGPPNERPQHEVTFKSGFAIAKYEVPQNLYAAVMGNNPSKWKGPRNSVEMMTWTDANEFCRKITMRLKEQKLIAADEIIRLPAEAEWEYCCRAGTTTKYSFGDEAQPADEKSFDLILTGFGDNKIGVIKVVRAATQLGLKEAKDLVEGVPKPLRLVLSEEATAKLKAEIEQAGGTCQIRKAMLLDKYGWHTGNAALNDPPVGALKPNPWGLYDMHGYLREFTADEWSDDYSQAPADGTAMRSDSAPNQIVLRSGSWKDPFDKLTSTARQEYSVKDADDAVGFRCVKSRVP